MRKLVLFFMVVAICLFARTGTLASYFGSVDIASSDSVATTAADTTIVDLDTLLAQYVGSGDLKANCKLVYKAFSTAGAVKVKITWEPSIDGSTWLTASVIQDSLETETWKIDSLPTNASYFKWARIITVGLTGNSADAAYWFSISYQKVE